jgi:hypothetical protein
MKKKMKLLLISFTTIVAGIAYSTIASAQACYIFSGTIYCF